MSLLNVFFFCLDVSNLKNMLHLGKMYACPCENDRGNQEFLRSRSLPFFFFLFYLSLLAFRFSSITELKDSALGLTKKSCAWTFEPPPDSAGCSLKKKTWIFPCSDEQIWNLPDYGNFCPLYVKFSSKYSHDRCTKCKMHG